MIGRHAGPRVAFGVAASFLVLEPAAPAPFGEAVLTAQAPAAAADIRNVILLVTDGGGVATWTAGRLAEGDALAVARMPVVGLVDTRNVDGGLTDSAAAASAYATGRRTFNRAISVAPECRRIMESPSVVEDPGSCAPLETLLERAEALGKSTGLVTTASVTDATPAAFGAHVPSRYLHGAIARQTLASGVDVLLGGGRSYYDGTAEEAEGDQLTAACLVADCPVDAAALAALGASDRRLIGLFAPDAMAPAAERSPDLPTMTRAALERLDRNERGFFLLVETEGTDAYQHRNLPLDVITAEILQFDRALAEALAFADRVPGTLVVVTSDHETGGMAILGQSADGQSEAVYGTGNHTHALVPLFAYGPGASRLGGMRDNAEVGRLLFELLGARR